MAINSLALPLLEGNIHPRVRDKLALAYKRRLERIVAIVIVSNIYMLSVPRRLN